jgi:hypothetical protein
MLLKKKISIPDWLKENELISLLLSHATTKYEYFSSRARVFSERYGADYSSFKKRWKKVTPKNPSVAGMI